MIKAGQVRKRMIGITEKEFRQLTDYIRLHYGIQMKEEKQTLITGRFHQVLQQLNLDSFTDYYKHIVSDQNGDAVETFVDKITTNYTYFMRESNHFQFFKERVLPYLLNTVKDKDLRIWSAGCSSGEEPYTLAMLMDEFFGLEKSHWDTKILATDIAGSVLKTAATGVYEKERIAPLPPSWRLKYFKPHDAEKSVLIDKIRNEVIYRKFNLMNETFPFRRKFHVIFCRNVMIYFNAKTKMNLVRKFYDLTEPGGYLFIGHSESLSREETQYKYIMPAVYRKE